MKPIAPNKTLYLSLAAGLMVGILSMILTVGLVLAAPSNQEVQPGDPMGDETCKQCHLDITDSWSNSPHAHAFDDTVFQQRWEGMGNPGSCLVCHTTNYQATLNTYSVGGVSCEACHGVVKEGHPPEVVPIRADTDYCGTCHTTTLQEWRLTRHASADVGCMDCHDPHSQNRLFDDPDNLCINCHKEDMEDYLEDLHVQKNIGCVDCHALVIPPDPIPEDGIVPTGHTFTITPATCVACHTDALHAGFHLPGFEDGAKASTMTTAEETASEQTDELIGVNTQVDETGLTSEQQIQALETALTSNRITTLFQGGVVGLVLGGSTAWFVAHNVRRSSSQSEESEEEEEEDDRESDEES
jgi:predicted CXXCH cytochrome family protein